MNKVIKNKIEKKLEEIKEKEDNKNIRFIALWNNICPNCGESLSYKDYYGFFKGNYRLQSCANCGFTNELDTNVL
jgi:ribosomal protein S27AE